jgi:cell division protein FtsB
MNMARAADRRNGPFGGLFRRTNIFLLLVLAWGFGYLLFFGNNSVLYHFILQSQIRSVTADILRLETENSGLAREIERIKNDPVHLEMLVRSHGYLRPSEKIYRVETASPTAAPLRSAGKIPPFLLQLAIVLPVLLGLAAVLLVLRFRNRPKRIVSGGPNA